MHTNEMSWLWVEVEEDAGSAGEGSVGDEGKVGCLVGMYTGVGWLE